MSESKDISRKRLADFLAARLRAKALSQPETQLMLTESSSGNSSQSDEHTSPASDS